MNAENLRYPYYKAHLNTCCVLLVLWPFPLSLHILFLAVMLSGDQQRPAIEAANGRCQDTCLGRSQEPRAGGGREAVTAIVGGATQFILDGRGDNASFFVLDLAGSVVTISRSRVDSRHIDFVLLVS